MLNNLIKNLHAKGIDAHETAYSAGLYYDGAQHGEVIPCVMVTNDRHESGFECAEVAAMLNRITPKGYTVVPVYHPHYDVFRIVKAEDKERGEELKRIADAFLGGFWAAVHEEPIKARENNAALAIAAGRQAIAELRAAR